MIVIGTAPADLKNQCGGVSLFYIVFRFFRCCVLFILVLFCDMPCTILTMMTLEMAMIPPITERRLGSSCSQTKAIMIANTGSVYIMLVTALAFAIDSAVAHVA